MIDIPFRKGRRDKSNSVLCNDNKHITSLFCVFVFDKLHPERAATLSTTSQFP